MHTYKHRYKQVLQLPDVNSFSLFRSTTSRSNKCISREIQPETIASQHELDAGLLTYIKGIKHIAGPLCVVTPTPEVDNIIQQHSCVAITHIWHFPGTFMSSCPHWRQLRPAQRHWSAKQSKRVYSFNAVRNLTCVLHLVLCLCMFYKWQSYKAGTNSKKTYWQYVLRTNSKWKRNNILQKMIT